MSDRYFAADKVPLKVQSVDSDDNAVAVTIIVLPHAHVLLT